MVRADTPSTHPVLYLLEQLVGRVAVPPIPRGRITLFINGGRTTNLHTDYLLPPSADFTLIWQPLTPVQQVAVQAVADVLQELEQAHIDCHLVLRIRRGQPVLPLIFHGRYPITYDRSSSPGNKPAR